MTSIPGAGVGARSFRGGLAVPISSGRDPCRGAADTTSSGQWAARASATAVLPTAVGPRSTGTLAPAKPALQLLTGQLHDGGAPVHIVRWQIGGKEPEQQFPHLALLELLSSLHCCSTSIGRGKAFQSIGPAAETSPRQIRNHLPEACGSIEPGVGRWCRVDHHGAAAECLCLEA